MGQLRSLNISISELAARELQRQSLGAKNKQVNPTGRRGCRSAKMPDLKSPGIGVQTRRALRAKLGQISKLATILGGTELRKLAERLTTQFSPESKDQRSSETSVAGALRRPRSGIIGRVGRFLLVTDFFLDFGASQAGIGGKVGRSDRTVRRHFSTKYRETSTPALSQRGGLEPIGKCQLAQRLGKAELEEFHWAEFDALHGSRDSGARRRLGRYLRIGGRLFRLGCNLYDLAPSRRWKAMRRRVRKRTNLVGADLLPNDLLLRKEPRRDLMGCKSEAELRRALERRLPDYPN